ncbi:host-nuclease inhibitor Gam family protein [Lactococcus lactis]|uniref:host-nuclease inhibitor Gam family protein n=1 Tax=Lactococcus lactis TaxID=1358 RepID=UPI00240EEC08|nr:host-nuclease inhibitor Gam family protein [Lactococcus lactis]
MTIICFQSLKKKGSAKFITAKTKTTESVDKKALKAFVKDGGQLVSEDGEIVEGFKFDKTEEFTVKV